jgi:hypothetical protein
MRQADLYRTWSTIPKAAPRGSISQSAITLHCVAAFVLLEIAKRDRYSSLNSPALQKRRRTVRLDVLKELGE